ncbi:uracil-DNA glycosylase [bacterium (Candidatus Howlettbacteria) CG_4_10_14_0_8_um_filter_40_9]|nr:MAG: uracil-DNA glycosylase [bacterium (Candidatus Howlettbacteria) CG_4_10_14_0_8_um_filter_40_9]
MTKDIQNAKSLEEISSIIADCKRCDLYQTKTKDVPGVGSPKAEIMFIGEAPGKKEDEEGEPFVGAAGKFLTEMIESIGLKRGDVYIANVLKHRPPENRDPFPEEAKACFPNLERQIEIIQPKLIVFLGRHAMNRFFPEFRISNVHGKAFQKKSDLAESGQQVYLALYHPAAALYNGGLRETLKDDFNKIPKILEKKYRKGQFR